MSATGSIFVLKYAGRDVSQCPLFGAERRSLPFVFVRCRVSGRFWETPLYMFLVHVQYHYCVDLRCLFNNVQEVVPQSV